MKRLAAFLACAAFLSAAVPDRRIQQVRMDHMNSFFACERAHDDKGVVAWYEAIKEDSRAFPWRFVLGAVGAYGRLGREKEALYEVDKLKAAIASPRATVSELRTMKNWIKMGIAQGDFTVAVEKELESISWPILPTVVR